MYPRSRSLRCVRWQRGHGDAWLRTFASFRLWGYGSDLNARAQFPALWASSPDFRIVVGWSHVLRMFRLVSYITLTNERSDPRTLDTLLRPLKNSGGALVWKSVSAVSQRALRRSGIFMDERALTEKRYPVRQVQTLLKEFIPLTRFYYASCLLKGDYIENIIPSWHRRT